VEFTLKKPKIPHFFFLIKTFRNKKTLKFLAKHWKNLENLVEFTLENLLKNPHLFFWSQNLLGEKKQKNKKPVPNPP
jgi:hypothetical protein